MEKWRWVAGVPSSPWMTTRTTSGKGGMTGTPAASKRLAGFCRGTTVRRRRSIHSLTVVALMGSLTLRDFASEPRPGYPPGRERSYARKPSFATEAGYLEVGQGGRRDTLAPHGYTPR